MRAADARLFGLNPIVANVLAVWSIAALNFLVADRWVFAAPAITLAIVGCPTEATAAELKQETIDAWTQYVQTTEARIQRESAAGSLMRPSAPSGKMIEVPSGLIHHWRGAVFVPGVTLDGLLRALTHPGTEPAQEDVLQSRVLAQSSDSLRVYLRLARRTLVTVVYDTEHEMTFQRQSSTVATSRSVATRIVEVEDVGTPLERQRPPGDDRGFLWRLNSYWRYVQADGGVWVELESLTLSRGLPTIIRPIAAPLVARVARESMRRTLDTMALRYAARKARG